MKKPRRTYWSPRLRSIMIYKLLLKLYLDVCQTLVYPLASHHSEVVASNSAEISDHVVAAVDVGKS